MAATEQGAIELRKTVQAITDDLKSIADLAHSGLNEGNRVTAKLTLRIKDGEAPRDDKIPELQAKLAALKAGLEAKAAALTVPTAEEFQALAETKNPA